MPRQARGEYVNPDEVQILHVVNRCVRRAFLCGKDPLTGTSFEHRREWIRDRLEFLASIFGIDCLTYTVMSNHMHLILRGRPDVVQEWSDEEVARGDYPYQQLMQLFADIDYSGWILLEARTKPADGIAALIEQHSIWKQMVATAQA